MCSERYVRYVHLCARRSKEKSEGPNQTMQATDKKTVTAFGLLCGPRLVSPQSENQGAQAPVPWVSTDLRILRPDPTWRLAPDCEINGRCYRKLDPEYFAWLRSRMVEVKAGFEAGRVDAAAFHELRGRFNTLQREAIALFGENALQNALRAFRVADYRPPAPEPLCPAPGAKQQAFPEQATRPDGAQSRAVAEAAVDAIREEALALGWTRGLRYGRSASGEPGLRRDLVTALSRSGTRVGKVTRQWIEIIGPPPVENRLRFYNPDVEQPWVKPV